MSHNAHRMNRPRPRHAPPPAGDVSTRFLEAGGRQGSGSSSFQAGTSPMKPLASCRRWMDSASSASPGATWTISSSASTSEAPSSMMSGGVGTVGGSVPSTQPVQWPYAPWLFVRRLAECPRAPKGRPRLSDATGTPDLQRAPVWHRWLRG